jgi:MFS transporter, DHA2 family, multidrug resistance protein
MASMLFLNHVTAYGKVEDWFASPYITGGFLASILCLLLFLQRQLIVKRPLFNLKLLRIATFRRGLFYFFILGVFLPGTFQSVLSGGVLQYDAPNNTELGLYLVPGILLGCIICYFWYYFKLDSDVIIILGFLSFLVYHIILYNYFSSNFSKSGFFMPSVIKGFATALIYISVGLLTTKNMKLEEVIGGAGMMILFRSFLGSGIFTSLYSYFFYTQRIKHVNILAELSDVNNPFVQAQGSNFYRKIQEQASLAASKEITGVIIIAGIVWIAILLSTYVHKKIRAYYL